MKKNILMCLMLTFAVAFLAGCGDERDQMYSIDDYNNESRFFPETSNSAKDPEYDADAESEIDNSNNLDNGFLVKDKKYTFEGNDLIIINVENQSGKTYSVTIVGSYLDKDGKVLKTETQTFDQYYPEYSNYHLFKPDMKFDSFSYTLSFELYTGEVYAERLTFSFNGLKEIEFPILNPADRQEGRILYPTILMEMSFKLTGTEELKPNGYCILFNENDEIITIQSVGGLMPAKQTSTKSAIVYQTTEDTLTWPKELKGDLKALYVLVDIKPLS